mgnify:CR=1 FL=1
MSTYIEHIEILVRNLFNSYSEDNSEDDIKKNILSIFEELKKYKDVDYENTKLDNLIKLEKLNELVFILKNIGKILNIKFTYLKTENNKQSTETTTLKDMFLLISKNHIHTIIENDKTYVCNFHQESLFLHLHLVMFTMLARLETESLHEKIKYAFIGLMHDIGKYETVGTLVYGQNLWTKFPFHGEMGSGILNTIWCGSKEFEKYFNIDEWENISRTICIHMCGYHETNKNDINARYKWSLLRIENKNIKENLYYLSFGDHYGAIRNESEKSDSKIFNESREDFKEDISSEFDIDSFFKKNKLNNLILMVQGMFSSGKSYTIKLITNHLSKLDIPFTIINRDQIMSSFVSYLLTNEDIKDDVEIEIKKIEPVTGGDYSKYIKFFQKKNLAPLINNQITNLISRSFKEGKLVILDTVMSLFEQIDYVLPLDIKNAFIMSLYLIRCKELTTRDSTKYNCTLQQQIKLNQSRNVFNWLPSNLKNRYKELSSKSSAMHILRAKEKARPSLVHIISWNDETMIGLKNFMNHLEIFAKYNKTIIRENKTPKLNDNYYISSNSLKEYLTNDSLIINEESLIENYNNFVFGYDSKKTNSSEKKSSKNKKKKKKIKFNFDERSADIITYVNHVYKTCNFEQLCDHIRKKNFFVTTPPNLRGTTFQRKIIIIKYLEHCKLWKSRWAREARGVALYLNKDNEWVCLKFQLKRGVEILTGIHINDGINNTENYDIKSGYEHLDYHQQELIKDISKGNPINGVLSFKCDGSLFGVSLFSNNYYKIMESCVEQSNNNLAKTVLNMAREMKLDFVPTFSSQATFLLGEEMQDYMVTAIISSTIEDFDSKNINKLSPVDVFSKYGKKFLSRINTFYKNFKAKYDNDCMTLSFEAICKNRKTFWNKTHPELAISYDHSGLKFLSASYGDKKITTKAHFQLNDILKGTNFQEPMYYYISHSKDIESILSNLSKCIRNKITKEEFIKITNPINYDSKNSVIDFEGFVFYSSSELRDLKLSKTAEHQKLIENIDFECNKIKTEEYYKTHKFRPENVDYLMELSETANNIFPITSLTKMFYSGVDKTISNVISKLMNLLNLPEDKNPFYESIPEDAKEAYKKNPHDIKMRILINRSAKWDEESSNILLSELPLLKKKFMEKQSIKKFCTNLMMKTLPWKEDNHEERLSMLLADHSSSSIIGSLFSCIVGNIKS